MRTELDTDDEDSASELRLSRQSSKRRRNTLRSDVSRARPSSSPDGGWPFRKELLGLLECDVCAMLLHEPMTTPCQHSFCGKCLSRTLDHSSRCPLCRQDLPSFAFFQDHAVNKVLLMTLKTAFPDEYAERTATIERDERDARLDTPIFVCTLAFPGMPTILHVFEPRYRLMIRRCIESSSPRFGMVLPSRAAAEPGSGVMEYGTMLEIQSVQMLPDGRSMVETVGTHRFKLLEKGNLDGYTVGRIERIDDVSPAEELAMEQEIIQRARQARPTTEEYMAMCRSFIEQLRSGSAPWLLQRLNNTYGSMPDDPSEFSYWMALVMPIDEYEKARLLPIRSPRLRLKLIVHWVESLRSSWW
ncbi:PUA-like domain-containing protein [Naematelia encephala]|uniref:PUA-like domain-containing protein n=1 Tax=Naematelia encephala TaxID=71784 RepID=A0A1Y2AKQ9_9TREE|nr:PUA-like domain-containing protein [Naematelia encephala]